MAVKVRRMARVLRIEYPGAAYHVMACGNHGQNIFKDDPDRRRFLETLGEACEKTGWAVHAYVLMRNHYHLLLETPEANLVAGMKKVPRDYTPRVKNRPHEGGAKTGPGERGGGGGLGTGV